MASFEDFSKLDLRVGKVLEAEKIEGSEKLLKLQVSIGEETRQILAGIAKSYPPENLIGKFIVVIANLDPRKMMGLESQGMLLAADADEGPVLLVPDSEVFPGARIK
ncbi:MAG: methionyl-tRNA synthetase [Parcubacteria group bacterium Gr01-1014_20]|nr:MAG: methionyl-tRNA synthetase [Parcubacteria group bacterium Gr01-1014_20]